MDIEGHDSPRDVASESKKHPWEIFPSDEKPAEKDGQKRQKDNKKKPCKFILWVKSHKLLTVGLILVILVIIIGVVIGVIMLNKNNSSSGNTDNKENSSNGIGIPYEQYIELLSLEKSSPENAFDYAVEKLKPILTEGIYNSEVGVDYTKLEDNFEVFIKKVEKEDEKICYRLAMIYTMYRLGGRSAERAGNILELFDEEKHELTHTQRYFYLMVQVEKATASENIEEAKRILAQIDEEYPVDEGYVDIDSGEEITDKEELNKIKESFEEQSNKEDE